MKKFFSFMLALTIASTLVACGSSGDTDVKEPVSSNPSNVVEEVETSEAPTIEEAILVDEAGIKITATRLEYDNIWGPSVKLLIENNTEKNLTVQARNVSVNGYMVDVLMSEDVAAGKKANTEMSFSEADLETCGITTIADMEFSFHVFDSDKWEDYFNSAMIQMKTSAAEGFEYTYDDAGTPVYEGNGVKIVAKGLSENDSIFGPGLILYMHNGSDKNITVQARDTSVNGFMIENIFSSDIVAGKHAIDAVTFFESDLEESEITEITEVELYFHIFDADDWEAIADTDVVTLNF